MKGWSTRWIKFYKQYEFFFLFQLSVKRMVKLFVCHYLFVIYGKTSRRPWCPGEYFQPPTGNEIIMFDISLWISRSLSLLILKPYHWCCYLIEEIVIKNKHTKQTNKQKTKPVYDVPGSVPGLEIPIQRRIVKVNWKRVWKIELKDNMKNINLFSPYKRLCWACSFSPHSNSQCFKNQSMHLVHP